MLFSSGMGYTIDETGITEHKKKKLTTYNSLKYYRFEEVYIDLHRKSNYIYLYDEDKKRVIEIDLPDEVDHLPIVDFLSERLEKYPWN